MSNSASASSFTSFTNPAGTPEAVREVYTGPERELWELLMGEQIHIDGFASSMALAEKAQVAANIKAIDLCCCSGAGLRFLAKFRGLASGIGVDMTPAVLELGEQRNRRDKVADKIRLVQADATRTGLPHASTDLVWGEDAWCYVTDKKALVREAVRLVKQGGTIAITDWMWGSQPADAAGATRFLSFMKFPNLFSLADYQAAFEASGAIVSVQEDTKRYAPAIERYLSNVANQYTYDALRIIGFDQAMAGAIIGEMQHALDLAKRGMLMQGMIVARKK